MTPRRKLPLALQEEVRQRANGLCEYCHTVERWQYVKFTIDHVIPLHHGGLDQAENLAVACFWCNRAKSCLLLTVHQESGQEVPLFNPRRHVWGEHFIWSADGLLLIGLTALGKATVETLQFNRQRSVTIRADDVLIGRHPPTDDPRQR